jgi:predicted acetyltransferase
MIKPIINKIKSWWQQSLVLENEHIRLLLVYRLTKPTEDHWLPSMIFDIEEKSTGKIVGRCDIRFGMNPYMRYMGNIGYTIYPPYRGHHYATFASELLLELAKESMDEVIITCNPDNVASIKTIERLGGELLGIEDVPSGHELHQQGEGVKCIYRIRLKKRGRYD